LETTLKVFKSDKFDAGDTASLSLFLYPSFLAIFAKDQNQANIGIHFYPKFDWNSLEKLIISDPLLKIDVPARVYLHQSGFSLVPGVLYSSENDRTYLEYVQELPEKSHFFHTALDSNNVQIVSFIEEKLKRSLQARFTEISFYHGSCSFLSYLFKERFNLIGQEILVNLLDGKMYLAAFTDQELTTFNMFEISKKEDLLKYVQILIKQLNFNPKHVRVTIYGVPSKSEITEEWAQEYFHNVRILTPHANQNYSHGFKKIKDLGLFEVYWQYQ
jgi:hypothetical protein